MIDIAPDYLEFALKKMENYNKIINKDRPLVQIA